MNMTLWLCVLQVFSTYVPTECVNAGEATAHARGRQWAGITQWPYKWIPGQTRGSSGWFPGENDVTRCHYGAIAFSNSQDSHDKNTEEQQTQ